MSESLPRQIPQAVLLFTDKTTTAPLFKALAQRYADRGLFFGEARKKSADALIKKFEVTKFPSLMIVQRGDTGKIDVIDYFGALKAVELEQFLNKHTPGYDGADKPVLKKLEPCMR